MSRESDGRSPSRPGGTGGETVGRSPSRPGGTGGETVGRSPSRPGGTGGETAEQHWFQPLAEHMGSAYLRYSFTKGTEQEVDALVEMLELRPGARVLDVGCGPGRHALALAERGFDVVGVDISPRFIELAAADAPVNARFEVADARALTFREEFDAVLSMCQGGFGLAGGVGASVAPGRELDEPILGGMATAVRPGGHVAVSAFSAYFQVRFLEDHDDFDAATGVNHEMTTVKDESGAELAAELWTTCFTPRELRLLARLVGLEPLAVHSVTSGDFAARRPTTDRPELLLVARRPAAGSV